MRPIYTTYVNLAVTRNFSPSAPEIAVSDSVQQVGHPCWNVQGVDFVLMDYRPPGEQMALRNQSFFAQNRELTS